MTDPLTLPTTPAPGPPRTPAPADAEADRLAQRLRLTAVLRGAAKGFGCAAAELWLLDDATRSLHRHAHWQADPVVAKSAGRRPLADAEADLAALAGGAVVLENALEIAAWRPHRAAGAAVCLPVSSDRTIHGVVWFFADRARSFSNPLIELAEIVGGRLAVEIERDALLASAAGPLADRLALVETKESAAAEKSLEQTERLVEEAAKDGPGAKSPPADPAPAEDRSARVEMFRLPAVARTPAIDKPSAEKPGHDTPAFDTESADWVDAAAPVALADRLWLPDGRLLAWCATVVDPPTDDAGLLVAAEGSARAIRDAARRFARKGAHDQGLDAGELLHRLGEPLWAPGASGDGFALALALVDPSAEPGLGGRGAYATAGPCLALRVRAAATATHAGDTPPLGWDADAAYAPRPFELQVRERLVLVAGDPRLTNPLAERQLADAFRAATADAHRVMTAEDCLARLRRAGCDAAQAALAIRRV